MKLGIRVRLLPVLIIVAMLAFAVRLGEFWTGVRQLGQVSAQEKVQAEPPPMPANAKKVGEPALPAIATAKSDAPADSTQKQSWKDATEEQYDCSDTQSQLNQDLVKRRDDLDKQTKDMAMKQALLVAAQHELDAKVTELGNLRNQIQSMMGTLTEQEKQRIQSLVKIYENMKPSDAARIFDTLDTDVLLQVMSQMKEAKSAAVLAAMTSERAKTVTVMLAQQKRMPDVPPPDAK